MEIINWILEVLKYVMPLAMIAVAILVAWGITKWFKRLREATSDLASNPITLVFAVLVIALFLWLFFSKILPIINMM